MLVFRNKGLIDIRAITTFGVSAKDNFQAIGFFGTGLKYAIAILLRNDHIIKMSVGGVDYDFFTQTETIRGKEFELVYMVEATGEPVQLGFTTELGKTWEDWQAFREIYCNTVDERGDVYHLPDDDEAQMLPCQSEETIFTVWGLDQVWFEKDTIILPRGGLLWANSCLEIHRGAQRDGAVFYRGIRAGTLNKPTSYTYNLLRYQELSEDRLIKYTWSANNSIASGVAACTENEVLHRILTAADDYVERSLDFTGHEPSQEFMDMVRDFSQSGKACNLTALALCRTLNRVGFAPVPITLDVVDTARLRKAVAFCRALSYPVDDYTIRVYPALSDDALGQADVANKVILLSSAVFNMGTKMLAGTLIEEWAHIALGHGDCTRGFQNWLVDNLCSLGERILGEPL